MKSLGIVRKIDQLGRIVIPKELRDVLDIKSGDKSGEGDPLEFFMDGEDIILRKYQPGCQFCGSVNDVEYVDNIRICKECAKKIADRL